MIFFDLLLHTLSIDIRVHRAGSQLKMSERQTKAWNQITLSLSLTLSLFLTLTLLQSLLTCWTTFVFISMLKSHSHTLTLSHTLSLSHCFNLSFNHSRHAEQFLFSCLCSKLTVYRRKLQWIFWDLILTLPCYFRCHRAGSQLKIMS